MIGQIVNMPNIRYNNYRGGYIVSKKKKKKTSLAARIMGIIMLVLMVGSTAVSVLVYFNK